jgi:hypothetical protein
MPNSQFITPEDLIERYKGRISIKTLANWRTKGGGPSYTKIGGKIMYPLSEVIEWERLRTYGSTAKRAAMRVLFIFYGFTSAAGALV